MSLRRVSSRQRLVSWDAFDASCTQEEEERVNMISPSGSVMALVSMGDIDIDSLSLPFQTISTVSPNDTLANVINGDAFDDMELKRKRRPTATESQKKNFDEPTTFTAQQIHVAPYKSVTNSENGTSNIPNLIQLPIEIQCSIYQYLNVREIRNVAQSCTTLRQMLLLQKHQRTLPPKSFQDEEIENDTTCIVESALWKPLCIQQYWPWLKVSDKNECNFILSTTVASTCTNVMDGVQRQDLNLQLDGKNYPMLLSMASRTNLPMQIDTSLFPCHRIRIRTTPGSRLARTEGSSAIYALQPKLISVQCIRVTEQSINNKKVNRHHSADVTSTSSIQQQEQAVLFVGSVGYGDQCVRANMPLPRPRKLLVPQKWKNNHLGSVINRNTLFQRVFRNAAAAAKYVNEGSSGVDTIPVSNTTSMFTPLRRSVRLASKRTSITSSTAASAAASRMISYRPFCSPFVSAINNGIIVNIAPRYIAYYEVTILSLEPTSCTNDDGTVTTTSIVCPTMPNTNGSRSFGAIANDTDCVAIGLATDSFPLQNRMPGWDIHSYGYHGDDGGIFHGNGSMIQQYNRNFGVNDTVGCGIDYIHQSIFFTLNGEFLGYAFPLLPQHVDIDLYPVIGMDTQYPIVCNFGINKPFVFDLQSMIKQQEPIIQQQLPGII